MKLLQAGTRFGTARLTLASTWPGVCVIGLTSHVRLRVMRM